MAYTAGIASSWEQNQLLQSVQQSAYLKALDQYIDYDWDGNVRKCLLDKNGKRLLDANGSPKTLRHKFAVYCDDIAAGAETFEELSSYAAAASL
jgi:hypothetical protein